MFDREYEPPLPLRPVHATNLMPRSEFDDPGWASGVFRYLLDVVYSEAASQEMLVVSPPSYTVTYPDQRLEDVSYLGSAGNPPPGTVRLTVRVFALPLAHAPYDPPTPEEPREVEFDHYPCPEPTCRNGDLLAEADPKCSQCNGRGTVVLPKED